MAEIKYAKAMKRLDEIVQKIENEEIDVDELSDSVKEAVELIRLCKDKLTKAEMKVQQVVEGFAGDEQEEDEK